MATSIQKPPVLNEIEFQVGDDKKGKISLESINRAILILYDSMTRLEKRISDLESGS